MTQAEFETASYNNKMKVKVDLKGYEGVYPLLLVNFSTGVFIVEYKESEAKDFTFEDCEIIN